MEAKEGDQLKRKTKWIKRRRKNNESKETYIRKS